jgi:hypothetical protein
MNPSPSLCNVFFSALHEAVDDGDHIRLHFELESAPAGQPTAQQSSITLPSEVPMHNTDSLNTAHWVAHVALPRQHRIRVRLVVHNARGDAPDADVVAKTPSRLLIPRGVEMRVTLGAADPAANAWAARDHVPPGHSHIRFLFGGVAAPGASDIQPSCLRWAPGADCAVARIRVSSNLPAEVPRTRLLEPPHTAQTSVTYTTTRALADCRFLLEFLAADDLVVARTSLLGSALADGDGNGFLRLPLLGAAPDAVLGEVLVYYLVVRAYAPRTADVHRVVQALPLRNIWKTVPSEDVGHRGSGAHNAKSSSGSRTWLAENTMLSFREAARNLLPFIEFDVQLSKDGVPVIWHDFHIHDDAAFSSRCTT